MKSSDVLKNGLGRSQLNPGARQLGYEPGDFKFGHSDLLVLRYPTTAFLSDSGSVIAKQLCRWPPYISKCGFRKLQMTNVYASMPTRVLFDCLYANNYVNEFNCILIIIRLHYDVFMYM